MNSPGPLAPPRGFRDILPTEARELRIIERTLGEAFASYGYVPIEPPLVEYSATQPAGERLIQFLDSDGSLVALRPDLTTAVARLVAQRYRDATEALRLSYFAPVFREEPAMTAGEREVVQAGIELIGPSGATADAEALALLVEALERCGLRLDATTIHVGHVGVVRRLFAALPEDALALVLRALQGGDHVGAFRHAREAGMSERGIDEARRGLGVIGRGIESLAGDDVMAVREVIHLARELYPGNGATWGVPNIALVPALPYYTGVVFEVLHGDVGPIASGGRYDLLLAALGAPRAATGFAINVARLHRALFASGWRPASAAPLVALRAGSDPRVTLRCAAALRGAGLAVALGGVAEPAGAEVVAVDVVDETRVKTTDGRTLSASDLARELAR